MSRFRGYRSIWSMCLTFALKGPRISTFRWRNPLELETPNLDWVFDGPDGVPSERTRNPRADRAPGRRFSFRANQQKPSSDLRPPLSGRSIPLLFFKARARQQNLEPRAIGPWRRPLAGLYTGPTKATKHLRPVLESPRHVPSRYSFFFDLRPRTH